MIFMKVLVLALGLSGFYITFVQAWQIWHIREIKQFSLLERRRQTAARSKALKEKYGSFVLLAAFLLSVAACVLVFLSPLIALTVFSGNHFAGGFCAFGILLWIRRAVYWLTGRFLT